MLAMGSRRWPRIRRAGANRVSHAWVGGLLGLVVALAPGFALAGSRGATAPLNRALDELVGMQGGPPGAIVLIQRGRHLSVHSAGVARIGSAHPPRALEHMRIASVSKAFSGATALALVADGRLSLHGTIGELLPDLPAAWHRVTLRQLLGHTSGLPDYTASKAFGEAVGESPTSAPPPRALLAFVADEDLEFRPGSRYQYSNSDNIVVALMIEAVTGTRYARALRRQVLWPLRLRRTSLPAVVELPHPFIHGYEPAELPEDVSEVVAFGGWAWASGGIVSTPAALNRFVRGYVGGRLYGGSVRARQFVFVPDASSEPPGPGRNAAGLGLFRYDTRCGTVYGHTGSILGYTQLIAATADGRTSVTFTINAQIHGDDATLEQLRAAQEIAICTALGKPRRRHLPAGGMYR